jgi:hypothetical protein
MTDQDFQFFKELVEAPSPSGFEQPAQRVIRKTLDGVVDELRTDVLGNVIATVNGPPGAPRLMLAGHCDEIGFMVKYIDDRGFLFFAPIGGVDAHLVPGQRVTVHTAGGPLAGVVGRRPIHQLETAERDKVTPFKSQFIDVGAADKAAAQELVAIGDPVTFAVGVERLQGTRVTSRAFDDKIGAFVVAQVLREVRRRGDQQVTVVGVSTVQEEVGLRGQRLRRQPGSGDRRGSRLRQRLPRCRPQARRRGQARPRTDPGARPEHQPGPLRAAGGHGPGREHPLPGHGDPAGDRDRRQRHATGAGRGGHRSAQRAAALHAHARGSA